MNTQDIIAEAKKRLAECEAEADKLRRMIAAAEGVEPVRLVPTVPLTFPMQPVQPSLPLDHIWRIPLTEERPWERGITITCASGPSAEDMRQFEARGIRPHRAHEFRIENTVTAEAWTNPFESHDVPLGGPTRYAS